MLLHLKLSCLRDSLLYLLILELCELVQIGTVIFDLVLEDLLEVPLLSLEPHFVQVAIHHFQVINFLVDQTYPVSLLR